MLDILYNMVQMVVRILYIAVSKVSPYPVLNAFIVGQLNNTSLLGV